MMRSTTNESLQVRALSQVTPQSCRKLFEIIPNLSTYDNYCLIFFLEQAQIEISAWRKDHESYLKPQCPKELYGYSAPSSAGDWR